MTVYGKGNCQVSLIHQQTLINHALQNLELTVNGHDHLRMVTVDFFDSVIIHIILTFVK